jgi:hypothetical protein
LTEESNIYATIGIAARLEWADIGRADVVLINGNFSPLR